MQDLDGATVCVAQGTTHELNLNDSFRARRIRFQPVVFERVDTMYEAFFAGRCDAMTQDASALAGALTVAREPAAYVVLEETISKEPLGPFTRNGDEQWSNIILWIHYALVEAEELGVTAGQRRGARARRRMRPRNDCSARAASSAARLGLDNRWAYNAIRAVGNYGEVFERNVGEGSPLKLRRGLNGLWTAGGLMYAIPFRRRRPQRE